MKENMYKKIIQIATIFLTICALAIYVVTQNVSMALGIIVGGTMNILGFLYIIVMVKNLDFDRNVQAVVSGHYLFRYLIYIIVFYICYQIGLNILTMLIGFLCINFGIIVYTKLDERRKIN